MTVDPLPKPPKEPEPPKEEKPLEPIKPPEPPKEEEVKPLPDPKPLDPPPPPVVEVPNDPSQDFEPPTVVTPEEMPAQPQAPASIDGTAVSTIGDVKYGWQDAPLPSDEPMPMCYHIGTVSAKAQLKHHAVGHEWVCTCGTVFVVTYTTGGKKTLTEKTTEVEPDGEV